MNNTTICRQCRQAIHHASQSSRPSLRNVSRALSTSSRQQPQDSAPNTTPKTSAHGNTTTTIATLLSKPTWSVRSLLPPADSTPSSTSASSSPQIPPITSITPPALHHLLRLSALPQPTTPAEESSLLQTLNDQLHFVRAIQRVDTTGIKPLRAIRDETARGTAEQTIGLDALREALAQEDVVGHAQRPRRRRGRRQESGKTDSKGMTSGSEKGARGSMRNAEEDWDVLGNASETAGRYFVVRSGGAANTP
ncbi:hypothetical protein F5Y15DRAFT_368573 [Xylariaceae sp. FL0016]|nr:hypothetical protein F5Y15DRAFT_368573 [Xylariaceae sp. FL0016]